MAYMEFSNLYECIYHFTQIVLYLIWVSITMINKKQNVLFGVSHPQPQMIPTQTLSVLPIPKSTPISQAKEDARTLTTEPPLMLFKVY